MALLDELQQRKEETQANRRKVLAEIVRRYGSVRATALALTCTTAQLYSLLNGRRNMGDKLARSLEEKLNLESGAFDAPPSETQIEVETAMPEKLKSKRIPLLSHVQAGTPFDQGDLCYDEYVEVFGNVPDGCYGLRVNGDSMAPLIDSGDVVVVNPNRWPKPGDYVVVRSALENINGAAVKRYYPTGYDDTGREIFEARSINSLYPPMHSVNQQLSVCGTVCKLLKDL